MCREATGFVLRSRTRSLTACGSPRSHVWPREVYFPSGCRDFAGLVARMPKAHAPPGLFADSRHTSFRGLPCFKMSGLPEEQSNEPDGALRTGESAKRADWGTSIVLRSVRCSSRRNDFDVNFDSPTIRQLQRDFNGDLRVEVAGDES